MVSNTEEILKRISELKQKGSKISMPERLELTELEKKIDSLKGKSSMKVKPANKSRLATDEANLTRTYFLEIDKIDISDSERVGDDPELDELGDSIVEHGQLQAILVQDLGNGRYRKLIGKRRILASQLKGIKKIESKVLNKDLTEYEINLIISEENNRRKNLSDYENVKFHIKQIADAKEISEKEAKELVRKMNNYKKGNIKGDYDQELEFIEKVIKDFNIFKSLATFSNNLTLLSLDAAVLKVLNANQITISHAHELNTLSKNVSTEVLKDLIDFCIKEKPSLKAFKEYAKKYNNKAEMKDITPLTKDFNSNLKKISKAFDNLSEDKKKIVNQKLKEIEDLLK